MEMKENQRKLEMAKSNSKEKGRLLESVVAALHRHPGVDVQQNVRLQVLNGSRKREIDVLMTTTIAGYPVRLAIECKNHRNRIGAPEIDAYLGKLQDIGIPSQLGIYVTVKGYTKGALERARKAGLRVLTLQGLSEDGLSARVADAIQSVVYLLPVISKMTVKNNAKTATPTESLSFFDKNGNFVGTIPDLILQAWITGHIPSTIGTHSLDFQIPDGWVQRIGSLVEAPISISAEVLVQGNVIVMPGYAENYQLVDSESNEVEKFNTNLNFDTTQNQFPLHVFESEEDLEQFWDDRTEPAKLIIGRIRLPRARLGNLYWPPSQRVMDSLNEMMKDPNHQNLDANAMQDLFAELEGGDLSSVWDPIVKLKD